MKIIHFYKFIKIALLIMFVLLGNSCMNNIQKTNSQYTTITNSLKIYIDKKVQPDYLNVSNVKANKSYAIVRFNFGHEGEQMMGTPWKSKLILKDNEWLVIETRSTWSWLARDSPRTIGRS